MLFISKQPWKNKNLGIYIVGKSKTWITNIHL